MKKKIEIKRKKKMFVTTRKINFIEGYFGKKFGISKKQMTCPLHKFAFGLEKKLLRFKKSKGI